MADYIDTTLVDGFAGGPHITEEQIGLINQGTYGPDDYVLEEGSQAEAEVLTNNSIRIKDAVFVIQGRRDVMAANDYEDISIDNGAQGVNRNDIIVRRYQKDESSEIESVSFAVIKGTATEGTATDPEVPTGDIRTGALLHNMKLYRVRIEGLNIVAVEPLFKVLMNAESVQEMLAELNSKKPVFLSSSAVNPSIPLTHESMEDDVIYDFVAVVQSSLDNTTYKQEITASLNSGTIGTNGDNANLMSTFMGQCVKGDVLSISSYKTGGNYSTFFTRVILIPE